MRPRDLAVNRTIVETIQEMRKAKVNPDDGWVFVRNPNLPSTPLQNSLNNVVLPTEGSVDLNYSPDFKNGFENAGGAYPPVSFHLTANGKTVIRGGVRGGAIGLVIFTLPVGYRPEYSEPFPVTGDEGVTNIEVRPNGDVVWIG